MAPHDVKKGNAEERERLKCGEDASSYVWDKRVDQNSYALVGVSTKLVCRYCFAFTEDMVQHTNKASGCALFLAIKHLKYCYVENYMGDDDLPDFDVCATILRDPKIPVKPKDIVGQLPDWNPASAFKSNLDANGFPLHGHTVASVLTNTNFHQVYKNYLATHQELDGLPTIPDVVTEAANKATGIHNFPLWLQKYHKKMLDAHVKNEIKARRLQAVTEQPRAATTTTRATRTNTARGGAV